MTTQVTIFLVALIICLTIICRWVLDCIIDDRRHKVHNRAEYWRGRYNSLANVLDKGIKFELSDDMLEEVEKIKLRNS